MDITVVCKNIRQLWLTLAIVTPSYKNPQKEAFKKELRGYTSPEFSFEIRQKAFEYINEIQIYNNEVIRNLVNASVHHNWRFRNFARTLVTDVLKNPGTKQALENQLDSFTEKEQHFLETTFKKM